MEKILTCFYCNQKSEEEYKKLKNFNINVLNIEEQNIISALKNIKAISAEDLKKVAMLKDHPLLQEYIRFLLLYRIGGLLVIGDFELVGNLDPLLENDFFIAYDTENRICSNMMWSKGKNNVYIKKILEEMEKKEALNITEILSKVFDKKLDTKFCSFVKLAKNSFAYPYDYFYPIDYEKCGKDFSENTKAIYHNETKLSKKQKLRLKVFRKTKPQGYPYFMNCFQAVRFQLASKKYHILQKMGKDICKKDLEESVTNACEILQTYKEKKVSYITIHNPRWMGVTSATKELFENLVPLQELRSNSLIDLVCTKILETQVEQVVFSGFCHGFEKLAKRLKEQNPAIKLKCFWHGSHSQVLEEENWKINQEVILLHKQGIIDVFASCKESIISFYKAQGYKTCFVQNTVRLDKQLLENVTLEKKEHIQTKIGLYSAGTNWRKNMYSQIAASSLIPGAVLDIVPLSFEAKKFAGNCNLEVTGIEHGLKREELLKRMAQNDINLYVTFSECAPMLPIESLEVGIPCLTGNNHHYFEGYDQLKEYLIVEREDDVIAIKQKIQNALEHKQEILMLYQDWKKEYDLKSQESVKSFLAM